jgi:hypothetical protein
VGLPIEVSTESGVVHEEGDLDPVVQVEFGQQPGHAGLDGGLAEDSVAAISAFERPRPTSTATRRSRWLNRAKAASAAARRSSPADWATWSITVRATDGNRVVQPQASGQVALPVLCDGVARFVTVALPSDGGEFVTGSAQVSAVLAVRQGRAKQVRDSAQVPVEPLVTVTVASQARLDGGGEAVLIDVTAACPASSTGQPSDVSVFKYPAHGMGTFTPTCDGSAHTATVRVPAANEPFGVGAGFASSTVRIQEDGVAFSGIDFHDVEITPG